MVGRSRQFDETSMSLACRRAWLRHHQLRMSNVQGSVAMTATFKATQPAAIPTLSEWGLMLLASLMAAAGLLLAPTGI